MIKFNDSSIIVGYIKELLYSFNLPQIPVSKLKSYTFNEYIPNITTNLKLENNIYDTYTHEYLGNYLRFIRDYKKIDLMSLYNCFSNKSYTAGNYVYFRIPVQPGITYTVKSPNISFSYWFTNKKEFVDALAETDVQPVVRAKRGAGNTLFSIGGEQQTKKYLIIKTLLNSSTNFVILEGDYLKNKTYWANLQFNFDKDAARPEESLISLISDISLVSGYNENRKVSPFAEKLIEYLIGNAIIPGDLISQNIIDAKEKARKRLNVTETEVSDGTDSYTVYDKMRFIDVVNKSRIKDITKDILGFVDTDVERALDDEGNE
jgi:hypothetical protein